MSNPGKFDRRVTVQVKTTTRGAEGGVAESWADLTTLWAQKVDESSREFRAALARHGETVIVFRLRYYAGLDAGLHRLVYESKNYDIAPPIEEGRREFMLVSALYQEGKP